MPEEDALVGACLAVPEDLTARLVYADWLDEHDAPARAEFIRLAAARRRIPNDAADRQKAVRDRLRVLHRDIDPKWAATFDEFDCLFGDSRTTWIHIDTKCGAPKRCGSRAMKVYPGVHTVLIHAGWEYLGKGQYYHYVRVPKGLPLRDPVIAIQVPTDAEVERLATEWHRRGEARAVLAGPWHMEYKPRTSKMVTSGVLNNRTGTNDTVTYQSVSAAGFSFGSLFMTWGVAVQWMDGDDKPPRWLRSSKEITDGDPTAKPYV